MIDVFRNSKLQASETAILRIKVRDLTKQRDDLIAVCERQLKAVAYFKDKIAKLERERESE